MSSTPKRNRRVKLLPTYSNGTGNPVLRHKRKTVANLIPVHLEHLQVTKGITDGTVTTKTYWLGQFSRHIGKKSVKRISQRDMERYILVLRDRIAPGTVYSHCACIKSFLNWCVKFKHIKVSPMKDIVVRQANREYRPVESPQALREKVLAVCRDDRDRLVIELLSRTGLRIAEVARATWEDLEIRPGFLRVLNGKGKKTRFVGVSEDFADILSRQERNGSPYLIENYKNYRRGTSPDTLTKLVVGLALQAGLKGVTAHTFRASVGTHIAEKAGIEIAQEVLGHAKIETTRLYVRYGQERVRRAAVCTD